MREHSPTYRSRSSSALVLRRLMRTGSTSSFVTVVRKTWWRNVVFPQPGPPKIRASSSRWRKSQIGIDFSSYARPRKIERLTLFSHANDDASADASPLSRATSKRVGWYMLWKGNGLRFPWPKTLLGGL